MNDINSRADLELLMRHFYNSLLADRTISYIFTDVAKIDLDAHLPHIVDFWEQNILGSGNYRNNVLKIHLDLNEKTQLTHEHFQTWLGHFSASVDSNFAGPNAEIMKTRALSIATVMQIKMNKP